jgi:hypothetical protein
MSRQLAIALFTLVIASLPCVASAEEYPRPNHAFLVDPVAPLLGAALGAVAVELEYQVAFHDYVGLAVSPTFVYLKWKSGSTDYEGIGGGARIGPRILPQGRRLGGAYVFPFAGFFHVVASAGSSTSKLQYVPIGIEAGYAWVWDNGFVINLGGGLSYDVQLADEPETSLPITPILNFTLGYAW